MFAKINSTTQLLHTQWESMIIFHLIMYVIYLTSES